MEADLRFLPIGSASLEHQVRNLLDGTLLMIEDLNQISGGRYPELYGVYLQIEKRILQELKRASLGEMESWLIPLADVGLGLERVVGGKAANLGEVKKIFPDQVPDGFVVTVRAYQTFISEPLMASEIRLLLDTLEVSSDQERFQSKAGRIRELMEYTPLPPMIEGAILDFAKSHWPLSQRWSVRSSAVGEDASMTFAGQFASFLNIPTLMVPKIYQKVLASRFNDRAIAYRLSGGITEVESPMAVLFLPLIEARSAGVLYTQDPAEPGQEEILISSTWGLAGDLVGGQAPADLFASIVEML